MEIFTTFRFEAAHRLPHVPAAHKCSRLHGHCYRVEIYARGPVSPSAGWVLDFADLEEAARPVCSRLDHRCLNDVPGLENPTCENIARWIWRNLKPALPQLCRLVVFESPECGCVYAGEGEE